ncbi:MAG: hypothetical protein AAF871_08280 [Pseudomonadota bacterium]
MDLIADILLIAGALGAGTYCIVLARRLNRFNDLEKGMGGAIAVLSAQVDDMTRTLEAAQKSAGDSSGSLNELTGRAEGVAKRLELLVASMHDLPDASEPAPDRPPSGIEGETGEEDQTVPFQSRRAKVGNEP